ncbi:unnamed protein product, partial [Effrenium voratum]
ACEDLRELMAEVGMETPGAAQEYNKTRFASLVEQVRASPATTPDQRSRLEQVTSLYAGVRQENGCHLFLAGAWPRQKGSVLRQNQQHRLLRSPLRSALFTFNSLALKRESWSDFLTWLATLEFVARFTATMEDSYHSAHEGRVHLHFFAEFNRPVDWTTLRPVIFGGITPNAQPTRARGPRTREAMDQGHFYCYAQKVGTLEVATSNYEPWIHYTVKGPWLDSLWSAHKLSHQTYLQYACQVRTGFIGRQRQVEAVQMHEERGRLLEQQAAAEVSLQRLKGDFKAPVLARCESWASQYQEPKMRYKFLILRGGSQSGKSTLAKSLGALSVEGVFQMAYIVPERLLTLVRPAFDLVLRRIRSLKRCVQACGCKIETPRYACNLAPGCISSEPTFAGLRKNKKKRKKGVQKKGVPEKKGKGVSFGKA